MGNNNCDNAQEVYVANDGDIYVTGYFEYFADFNVNGPGGWSYSEGYRDAFILKLD